ncbi:dephospho-CoA kinase [Bifidobacterium gallicum]|uniref:Dephospho-CoA kinase n=1 Tax=Bifidobacterium gallicum DSM 20093 = LMG 11596 TaxID=561180 RepID=D1NWV3_9BIFI|nr:dephospho-CoA kinase [Bifidobacterium gallicum]EFA22162.1 dephospho-CoA kinase [Bifidobacterium gallicum DSM 20093 = LMG 11596]
MIRIALTGGIAAGKSTVSQHLRECGIAVIDYDELTHILQEPGSPAIMLLEQRFGPDVIDADGRVDRAALAARVFGGAQGDNTALADLNAIMHPLIDQLAAEAERHVLAVNPNAVIVHDIPLYADVHEHLPVTFDHVMTVEAPVSTRVQRMMRTRAMSREQALARIVNQATSEQREQLADAVIDGNAAIPDMDCQVDQLLRSWHVPMAATHAPSERL